MGSPVRSSAGSRRRRRGMPRAPSPRAQGSLATLLGAPPDVGGPIGLVGNSGNTTEPHLHVHAPRRGSGRGPVDAGPVALSIEGRLPIRNDTITVRWLRYDEHSRSARPFEETELKRLRATLDQTRPSPLVDREISMDELLREFLTETSEHLDTVDVETCRSPIF